MKTMLIYDTETTGLPVWSKPSEDPCQPRVIQLAAELCEEESGEVLRSINFIIKPDGWTIPPEIQTLTGITQERAEKFGTEIDNVLPFFMHMWKIADFRVAHNESFDMRMIRIEMMRNHSWGKFADLWKEGKSFCTQGQSTKIINLPPTEKMRAAGRSHAKSPNLGEAYKHFTGKELEGAHNAAIDIMACKAVYYGIKNSLAKAA